MKIDKNGYVEISSMTKEQAEAFIAFLETEIKRHKEDIEFTKTRIEDTKHWFGIK